MLKLLVHGSHFEWQETECTLPSCGNLWGPLEEVDVAREGGPAEGLPAEDGLPEGLCPPVILPLCLTHLFIKWSLKKCY